MSIMKLNDADMTCMILGATIFQAPVIREEGGSMDRALILRTTNVAKAINWLRKVAFEVFEVSANDTKKDIEKKLAESNGAAIVLVQTTDASTYKQLTVSEMFLDAAAQAGLQRPEGYCGTPIICCTEKPNGLKCQGFQIEFIQEPTISFADILEAFPDPEHFSMITKLVEDRYGGGIQGTGRFLVHAAAMYYPYYRKHGDLEGFERLMKKAEELNDAAADALDSADLLNILTDVLADWLVKTAKVAHRLPELTMSNTKQIEQEVFYDDDHIYLSEQLFEQIFPVTLGLGSAGKLKALLADADVLVVSEPGVYTGRMRYINISGCWENYPMLRIRMDKLEKTGSISIYELMRTKEEKKYE